MDGMFSEISVAFLQFLQTEIRDLQFVLQEPAKRKHENVILRNNKQNKRKTGSLTKSLGSCSMTRRITEDVCRIQFDHIWGETVTDTLRNYLYRCPVYPAQLNPDHPTQLSVSPLDNLTHYSFGKYCNKRHQVHKRQGKLQGASFQQQQIISSSISMNCRISKSYLPKRLETKNHKKYAGV